MSVYSTPILSSFDDEASCDESLYFTPEVSFSCFTPCRRKNRDTETANYYGEQSATVSLRSASIQESNRSVHLESRFSENSPSFANESRYFTPKKSAVCITPKRIRSTPLRCISNIATPVEVKRNIFKFDDRITQLEKENRSDGNSNNSSSITSISDSSVALNSRCKNRSKSGNKSKSGMLQWLGVRHKSKIEFSSCKEDKRKRVKSNSPVIKKSECHLTFPVKNYGTIHDAINENSLSDTNNKPLRSSLSDVNSVNDSHLPLLPKKCLTKKGNSFWNYVRRCRQSVNPRRIPLSPVKRLFLRCRQKLSIPPLTALFTRNKNPVCYKTEPFQPSQNTCRCSVTSTLDEEFMNKVLSKLNSLENQIKEIKSLVHTKEGVAGPCGIPPPPPPPPPPLPNLIPITLKRKVDETTPESQQVIKRPARAAEARTQFSITVEDLRSVKLRKTPAASKRPSGAINSSTPGTIDGVLRSVKFKPSRRSAMQKKELSHIVADILSPSKKSGISDTPRVPCQSLEGDKENRNSSKYQTTPMKSVNKGTKLHFTKPKDLSWESPSGRRSDNHFKSHVYCDDTPMSVA